LTNLNRQVSKTWYTGTIVIVGANGHERNAQAHLVAHDNAERVVWGGQIGEVTESGDPPSLKCQPLIFRMPNGLTGELTITAVAADGSVEVRGIGPCPFG
jgi:hypothetical protein